MQEWFGRHEADALGRRIERDASAGRLDAITETALAACRDGKARTL